MRAWKSTSPDIEAKLEQMARATGSASEKLVKKVVSDFFDDGLALTRGTLDRRFRAPMTANYDLRPETESDMDAIWEFIAEDHPVE